MSRTWRSWGARRQHFISYVLFLVTFGMAGLSCDNVADHQNDDRQTLGESILESAPSDTDNVSTNDDEVAVAGTDASLSVAATEPSNPFVRSFRARLDEIGIPDAAACVWKFGDGGVATTCEPTHTYASDGVYQVVLAVTLSDSSVYSATLDVIIESESSSSQDEPIDVAGLEDAEFPPFDPLEIPTGSPLFEVHADGKLLVTTGEVVHLKATSSNASDPLLVDYLWQQQGGPFGVLTGANSPFAVFEVPDAPAGTEFVFALRGMLGDNFDVDQFTMTLVDDGTQEQLEGAYVTDPAWGLDFADATDAIQSALDSGEQTIVIPFVGQNYIVRPLQLRSNLNLIIESGVVIEAMSGAYPGEDDSVFSMIDVENVAIEAFGATIQMPKSEYIPPFQFPQYQDGEWRHAVNIRGGRNIQVLGLHVDGTGGDGIYISPTWDFERIQSQNITLRDCHVANSYRNGITVLSGENILIENCQVTGTGGRPPQASFHIEPENTRDRLVNVEVRNSVADQNEGSGFVVNITELSEESAPVSVLISDCSVTNARHPGLRPMITKPEGGTEQTPTTKPSGSITFRRCYVSGMFYPGVWALWDHNAPVALVFDEVTWDNVALYPYENPIHLKIVDMALADTQGIEFRNCQVLDDEDRDAVTLEFDGEFSPTSNIFGDVTVVNPAASQDAPTQFEHCPELHLIYEDLP